MLLHNIHFCTFVMQIHHNFLSGDFAKFQISSETWTNVHEVSVLHFPEIRIVSSRFYRNMILCLLSDPLKKLEFHFIIRMKTTRRGQVSADLIESSHRFRGPSCSFGHQELCGMYMNMISINFRCGSPVLLKTIISYFVEFGIPSISFKFQISVHG